MPRRAALMTVRVIVGTAVLVALLGACADREVRMRRATDLEEATRALEHNLAAIQRHDVETYLDQYLDSPDLIAASADSLRRGYLVFAEARRASDDWPDTLITGDPTAIWIAPGVVWTAFEYAAVVTGDTVRGWSERLFVKTPRGWKIAVTGMMQR
jgi:hypothetical protein